jgi:hypothetical protein
VRGSAWLGTRPRVHSGFLASWQKNDLHGRIIGHIRGLLDSGAISRHSTRAVLTGRQIDAAQSSPGCCFWQLRCPVQQPRTCCKCRMKVLATPLVDLHTWLCLSIKLPGSWAVGVQATRWVVRSQRWPRLTSSACLASSACNATPLARPAQVDRPRLLAVILASVRTFTFNCSARCSVLLLSCHSVYQPCSALRSGFWSETETLRCSGWVPDNFYFGGPF